MAGDDGWDDGSGNPDEEGQEQEPRRVRPLFRFRRGKEKQEETAPPPADDDEGAGEEVSEDEDLPATVRPVRVVKFVPHAEGTDGDGDAFTPEEEEEGPFAFTEDVGPEPATLAAVEVVDEEDAQFTETEIEELSPEGSPFVTEEPIEAGEEDEPPFTIPEPLEEIVEEPPFAVAEAIDEGEEEEGSPFEIAEPLEDGEEVPSSYPTTGAGEEEGAFAVVGSAEPGMAFTEVSEEERPIEVTEEVDGVPEVPFAVIEDVEREEPVDEGVSTEEEAEIGDELGFRQEETPTRFERDGPGPSHVPADRQVSDQGGAMPSGAPAPSEPGKEVRPHYHKYLKPDEDLLSRPQAKGRPTGFDRDLESEAGEIDFGIDLIDPHERRKKKPPKKGGDGIPQPKKGNIGGHDSDGEVGTRELGVDIGVDYTKRRKRRL